MLKIMVKKGGGQGMLRRNERRKSDKEEEMEKIEGKKCWGGIKEAGDKRTMKGEVN